MYYKKDIKEIDPVKTKIYFDWEQFKFDIKTYAIKNKMELKEIFKFNGLEYTNYQRFTTGATKYNTLLMYQERLDQLEIPINIMDYYLGVKASSKEIRARAVIEYYQEKIEAYTKLLQEHKEKNNIGFIRDYEVIINQLNEMIELEQEKIN